VESGSREYVREVAKWLVDGPGLEQASPIEARLGSVDATRAVGRGEGAG
jgi:hypothetical protein